MKAIVRKEGMDINFSDAEHELTIKTGKNDKIVLSGKNARAAIQAIRTVLDGCRRFIIDGATIRLINSTKINIVEKLMAYLSTHQLISETSIAAFLVA